MEMSGDNDNSGEEEQTEKTAGKRKTKQVKLQKTCCSDDEFNGGDTSFSKEGDDDAKAFNLNGKTRASLGAATDPQSLYARVIFTYIYILRLQCFFKCITISQAFKEEVISFK